MTDHRQPPPIAGPNGLGPSVGPATKAPLALPMPPLAVARRLGLNRRRVSAAIAIILGVPILGALGDQAVQLLREWLGAQPAYQVPFRSIVLEPPPPDWYRGGTLHFLDDVRRLAKMPETVPILKLEDDDLNKVFVRSPWTDRVRKVVYQPLGVTVRLDYRRPVALVETSTGEKYLVDGSAVILPLEDLDTDIKSFGKQHGLIGIKGDGLMAPLDPRPGVAWKTVAGVNDVAPGNSRVSGAARLASFLFEKGQTIDKEHSPSLDFLDINPMDSKGRGLFLWNAEETYVLWGEEPDEANQGVLEAEEKWERLREWDRRGQTRVLRPGDFWRVTPEAVVYEHARAPLAARRSGAVRDDSAVRTNRSGQ